MEMAFFSQGGIYTQIQYWVVMGFIKFMQTKILNIILHVCTHVYMFDFYYF